MQMLKDLQDNTTDDSKAQSEIQQLKEKLAELEMKYLNIVHLFNTLTQGQTVQELPNDEPSNDGDSKPPSDEPANTEVPYCEAFDISSSDDELEETVDNTPCIDLTSQAYDELKGKIPDDTLEALVTHLECLARATVHHAEHPNDADGQFEFELIQHQHQVILSLVKEQFDLYLRDHPDEELPDIFKPKNPSKKPKHVRRCTSVIPSANSSFAQPAPSVPQPASYASHEPADASPSYPSPA